MDEPKGGTGGQSLRGGQGKGDEPKGGTEYMYVYSLV